MQARWPGAEALAQGGALPERVERPRHQVAPAACHRLTAALSAGEVVVPLATYSYPSSSRAISALIAAKSSTVSTSPRSAPSLPGTTPS
ncbi:MAG TPA: hypothetical protein VJT79_04995 [Pseudonocardia sp.]|nr:hypothetical protein [Pseudonocardia sp.]